MFHIVVSISLIYMFYRKEIHVKLCTL